MSRCTAKSTAWRRALKSVPHSVLLLALAQVICTKVRDGDKRIVRLKEGTPKGRHVVIVDDLVQSGAQGGEEGGM